MAVTAKNKKKGSTVRPKPKAISASSRSKTTSNVSEEKSADENNDNGEQVLITPPAPSRGGTWILILLLLIGAAIGGAYLSWPKWYPFVEPYLPKDLAIQIEDPRVGDLSSRIDRLEATPKATPVRDETIARLEAERAKLSKSLGSALQRIESIEHSISAVKEMVKAAATAAEAAEATKSLKQLNERLSRLEAVPAGTAPIDTVLAERVQKLEQNKAAAESLAAHISALKKASARASVLATMETRLKKLEDRPAAAAAKPVNGAAASVTVLSVAQLRDAVQSGEAYADSMVSLRAIAETDLALKAPLLILEKQAKSGTPTLAALSDGFSRLAGKIVAVGGTSTDSGWLDRAVSRISSLVSLRRIDGGGDPNSVETIVAHIETRLGKGDLIAAVKSADDLKKVSGQAHEIAKPWLSRAKGRLNAERALASLHVHAASLLAPTKE
mgnify:FL=1